MATFGYCRVSTAKQAAEGESLDVQRRQIEEGVSGSVPVAERPAAGPLFAKLTKGDVVIAPKLDRLFRSALDALRVVEELKARGVRLHLLDLGGDIAGNGLSKFVPDDRRRVRRGRARPHPRANRAGEGRSEGPRPISRRKDPVRVPARRDR
ncbi:MAG TPA: recombinase family protein [Roseiarcus sp.]|nr:recombinase family protein [Roseiarcus sp.]